MKRALLSILLLTLIYALVLASFAPLDLAFGAALSGALLLLARRSILSSLAPLPGLLKRLLAFGPFLAAVFKDAAVGTLHVTSIVLHLRQLESPGIVAVPIGDRTRVGVAVAALVTTISPGEFLVDVDWRRRVMLIHSIDAADPEKVRRSHEDFYQRYQRRVFP